MKPKSEIVGVDASSVIDFPRMKKDKARGGLILEKTKRGPQMERAWVKSLMDCVDEWWDVVGIGQVHRVSLEYQVGAVKYEHMARRFGLPRVDAVAYHEDGSVTLVEAKLTAAPVTMLGGVAQLLHYKTLLGVLEDADVRHLVLASPVWPPFLLETIEENKLSVRLLKVQDDKFIACIPTWLR